MKNKKRIIIITILFLIAIAVFAQNLLTPSPVSETQNSEFPLMSKTKPVHHAEMPRKKTYLKFDRFQQDVDFEKKLKTSNKLLY